MALKFLNKKGWHTGSLRNIENVWKAEQKHDAEEKKLEELRKQIHEERERSEFRQLQVEAGLVPRQERLDFLYESGLAVGKSSDGFKALEAPAEAAVVTVPVESGSSKAAVPGALFEDKPQSSNDAWRKLHSDPLLLIRQREQEALARIKNNPIQMSMIRKSVETEKNRSKDDKGKREKKKHKRKHHHKSKSEKDSDSENTSESEDDRRKRKHDKRKHLSKESSDDEGERRKYSSSRFRSNSRYPNESEEDVRNHSKRKHSPRIRSNSRYEETRSKEVHVRNRAPRMTEEEREARLREMQMDAELHEEQRWKRVKNAAEADAREAARGARSGGGKNFLDAAQKSIFGTEKGGSSTIEESVRRRAYYSQGGSAAHESNAFRR